MIQDKSRKYYDELVYFGSADDLKAEGKASAVTDFSMLDRYYHDAERYGIWYNDDLDCRERRHLEKDKEYLILYNGQNSLPFILELGVDEFDANSLHYEATIHAVAGTPKWGVRANEAVFDYHRSALVYMTPEMMSADQMLEDWRITLMMKLIQVVQETQTSLVPLIVPYKQDKWTLKVPQLSEILAVEKEELPNYFLVEPLTGSVVPYPDPIEDVRRFTPENVLLWARRTALYLHVELWEAEIEVYNDAVAGGHQLSEDEAARLKYNKDELNHVKGELETVVKELEALNVRIFSFGENEFADNIQRHADGIKEFVEKVEEKVEENQAFRQEEL